MEIGQFKSISVKLPENYPESYANKTATFEVVLKSIQERELPELNDEFAKTADPEKNFESFK